MTRHHGVTHFLRCLFVAVVVAGRCALGQSVASSLTLDSLVGATDAAVLGQRVFVVTHTGVVNVLDATSRGELHSVGELRDATGEGGSSLLEGATGVAAAYSPTTDGTYNWVTVGSASRLVTLHQSSDGQLDVVGQVSSPQLAGAASVTVRRGVALIAAVAADRVVSVDVTWPDKAALASTIRLSGVDHLDWPEDGLARVASGSAGRLTLLSVASRGGLAKHGSVKDVRLGAAGASRAKTCTPPAAPHVSVVLSGVAGTTLALVNATDRGAPAVVQGLAAAGAGQPEGLVQMMDSASAWPSGYASLAGATALACVNGTAFVAVPGDGDGTDTGHLTAVQVAAFDAAVQSVLQHEALRGVGVLVPAPWGLVAVAPETGRVTTIVL